MKIYTKTGDDGETGLFGGGRVSKADIRIEAYGTVDELNAVLGCARQELLPAEMAPLLEQIQHELFSLGAELASPHPERVTLPRVGAAEVESLERAIDRWEATLAPLRQFILPGGCRLAAVLHWARTVCRRAERHLVALRDLDRSPGAKEADAAQAPDYVLQYLNRLSDLLFVWARAANAAAGQPDVPWRK